MLSRRVLLEKERAELKEETLEKLKEGQIVEGIVKNLTEYGAFIDLGGIDGLLHITDMTLGPRQAPVASCSRSATTSASRSSSSTPRPSASRLGLKQISEDPWTDADEKYPPGTVRRGKVVSLKDYGAFIELEQGIEGLVHISEMSWTRRVKHPSKMVAVGDTVEAVVLDIDPGQNRIALGMKQLEPNPCDAARGEVPAGHRRQGPGPQHRRLRHLRRRSRRASTAWCTSPTCPGPSASSTRRSSTRRATRSRRWCSTSTSTARSRTSRSASSSSSPDPWDRIPDDYPVGKIVEGKVIKVLDFGAFVEIEKGIEGLVHVSELREERVENPRDVVKEGDELEVKIIDIDTAERKIALSIKAAAHEGDDDYREYLRKQGGDMGKARLGDVMKKFNR